MAVGSERGESRNRKKERGRGTKLKDTAQPKTGLEKGLTGRGRRAKFQC